MLYFFCCYPSKGYCTDSSNSGCKNYLHVGHYCRKCVSPFVRYPSCDMKCINHEPTPYDLGARLLIVCRNGFCTENDYCTCNEGFVRNLTRTLMVAGSIPENIDYPCTCDESYTCNNLGHCTLPFVSPIDNTTLYRGGCSCKSGFSGKFCNDPTLNLLNSSTIPEIHLEGYLIGNDIIY